MAKRSVRNGQGFSLFDLKDTIAEAVDLVGDGLSRQGVPVDKDNLFLQFQGVVQNVGSTNVGNGSYSGYPSSMIASEAKVPYSVAGDLLAMAYEYHKGGDKKEAVKTILAAMSNDDFGAIASGLIAMNKRYEMNMLQASDEETDGTGDEDTTEDEDETEEDDTSDVEDTDEDEDDNDIDDIIADYETTADDENTDTDTNKDKDEDEDEDENKDKEVKPDAEKKDKPVEKKPDAAKDGKKTDTVEKPKPAPMGETSKSLTASHTSKVLANRLSLQGDAAGRSKAQAFIKKHANL